MTRDGRRRDAETTGGSRRGAPTAAARLRDATTGDGRALLVALALTLVLTVAVATVVGTATASAQASGADGEATVEVTLPEAPDGLAGYQLTLEVASGTVTGASYPGAFQPTTEPSIADDGRSVALEAADVSNAVQAGDDEVVLATVSVADAGEQPSVSVTDATIDADGGDRIDPDSVAVSVQGPDGTTPADDGTDAAPTDDVGGDASPGADGSGGAAPTEADGPGFGVLAVLGALLGMGTLARRR